MSDIADLFQRDPLSMTKVDITEIIKYYRAASAQFALGEKSAGATKKMKAPAGPKEKKLDLDDLLD